MTDPSLLTLDQIHGFTLTIAPCEWHHEHRPTPQCNHLHHVVPRDWQRAFEPKTAPHPGKYDGEQLWDARREIVCPTGHYSVHTWLVRLVVGYRDSVNSETNAELVQMARSIGRLSNPDLRWAMEGITRFWEAGGSIRDHLLPVHAYGQI